MIRTYCSFLRNNLKIEGAFFIGCNYISKANYDALMEWISKGRKSEISLYPYRDRECEQWLVFEKGVNTAAIDGPGRLEGEFEDFSKFSLRPVDMINVRILVSIMENSMVIKKKLGGLIINAKMLKYRSGKNARISKIGYFVPYIIFLSFHGKCFFL